MHIPDGMLSTGTWVTCWFGAGGVFAYACSWVRTHLDRSKIVVMAVLAAMVFALQMLNFPVAGGTSGHFGGGVLAALVLGPLPASLVMSAVLVVQAVFFGDGGITTLGANILNMGVIAPFVGWAINRLLCKIHDSKKTRIVWAAVAAWFGVFVPACAVAVELWASGSANFLTALYAMGFWHAIIGIGEAVITAGVITFILNAKPDLLDDVVQSKGSNRGVTIVLGIITLLAAGLSFLASSAPDGLEFVYFEELGFAQDSVVGTFLSAPWQDYVIGGIGNETLAGVLAGIVGAILVAALGYVLVRFLKAGANEPFSKKSMK
ncbi:MAG: cobalamin biosynthesis protein CbiM [Actinobacteria bacterium]|nr:cobalamin biosynthesis protein CbiM [Actinomycetota bacterium]